MRASSTLGRFRDPVLSTMIAGSAEATASLVFHELAHQVVYVRDDTAFNESFATFVAAEGMRRWRAHRGLEPAPAANASRGAALRAELARLRELLTALYESDLPEAEMRAQKAALYEAFAGAWAALGGLAPAPANNAALVPIALYADRTDAFAALLAEQGGDLGAFYAAVRELAETDKPERDERLDALAATR